MIHIDTAKSVSAFEKEVFKYLGVPQKEMLNFDLFIKNNFELYVKVKKTIEQMQNEILPKAVYSKFEIESIINNEILATPFKIISKNLSDNFQGCKSFYVMAATLGPRVDFLIQRYSKFDVGYASILQATGAMFIESYVDSLNECIRLNEVENSMLLKPRFSPGYGDLNLTTQKDIFAIINPEKIGITLMDSLIMSPEKSVTAFIGVYKNNLS